MFRLPTAIRLGRVGRRLSDRARTNDDYLYRRERGRYGLRLLAVRRLDVDY